MNAGAIGPVNNENNRDKPAGLDRRGRLPILQAYINQFTPQSP